MKRRIRGVLLLGLSMACGLPTAGTLEEGYDAGLAGDGGGALPDASKPLDAALVDGASADGSVSDASGSDGALADGASADAAGSDGSVTDGAPADASNVDAFAADASRLDASSGGDAAACVPRGAEDCTNGVDDDCNGLVDCADSACTPGFSCVPEVPSGWSLAALAIGSRSPCPGGYASQRDVVMDPTGGAATCSCSCSSAGTASCTDGSATFYGPVPLTNDCFGIGTLPLDVADGTCRNTMPLGLFVGGIGPNASVRVSKVALKPNTCTASVQKSVSAPGTTEGKRCLSQSAAVGGGCSAGFVCARKTNGQYQACVAKGGSNACPAAYPTKHDTGTGVTDTRSCSACTCGSTASCGDATVTFYEADDCQGTAVTAVADDTCRAMSTPGQSVESWRYAAPVLNAGCAKTSDTAPTGALSLNAPETVCCL